MCMYVHISNDIVFFYVCWKLYVCVIWELKERCVIVLLTIAKQMIPFVVLVIFI